MAHKRLNLKFAKKILGVDFEQLMVFLKLPETEYDKLRSRTFLVLNELRLPRTNLIMSRLNSMREMLREVRRTFRADHVRANKWFNSHDISFAASYNCKCPLDIVRWEGSVGMQMIRQRLLRVRELGGDRYNPRIPKRKIRRTADALES